MYYGQHYTQSSMLLLYNEVMNRAPYTVYRKLSAKTVTNLLSAWSSVDGSWLVKSGYGREAIFYKREPKFIGVVGWMCQFAKRLRDQMSSLLGL